MAIQLFDHNQQAYDAALAMLATAGKAAILTGTGKSFIGFKLCADSPKSRICWLFPSDYIFKTQVENWESAGGEKLSNVDFYTYAKLMMAPEELKELSFDYLVLDEFRRCDAEMWGQGVQRLLESHPEVSVLGLTATSIRY